MKMASVAVFMIASIRALSDFNVWVTSSILVDIKLKALDASVTSSLPLRGICKPVSPLDIFIAASCNNISRFVSAIPSSNENNPTKTSSMIAIVLSLCVAPLIMAFCSATDSPISTRPNRYSPTNISE